MAFEVIRDAVLLARIEDRFEALGQQAFLALYWRRLPLLRCGYEPGAGLTTPIQRFQSGVVNDYVTWVVLGLAAIGGVLALIIR